VLKVAPKPDAVPPAPDAAPATAPDARANAAAWRRSAACLAVGIAAVIAVYFETAARMIAVWWYSPTFNHAFLIAPICGYLVWIRREALAKIRPVPTLWGVVLAAGCAFGWLLGEIASVNFVQQLALVGLIQAVVIGVVGLRAAWAMAFPLFYLFFTVPAGDFLIAPLQDFTAQFVVVCLRLIGIPVFLDGTFLAIPTGNFEVAEACAGVRFLIATVALGFLYANLTYHQIWRRIAFVALSVVVPIIANGFRAFGIVAIAYATDHTVAVGVDHIVYGWIFFALVTVLLLGLGLTFRERSPAPRPPAATVAAAGVGRSRLVAVPALTLAAAVAGPVYADLSHDPGAPLRAPLALPSPHDGWQEVPVRTDWTPHFPGTDATVRASFAHGDRHVDVFVAYYTHQRRGAEAVSFDNALHSDPRSIRVGTGLTVAPVDGQPTTIGYTRLLGPRGGRLIWQWYWIDGKFTAVTYVAKLLQVQARLLGGPPAAAVVLMSSAYGERPQEAMEAMSDFLRATPPLRPMLERAGGK
jgi:exosortase A